ncbi:MAG: hypothetical protein LBQ21_05620 [Clostridiales Family XIII bacterium]|jgi:hypothetical protein|nr:hypothetical protein [Clostridiales Family XIII bacterium]
MDNINNMQHKNLAANGWSNMALSMQLGNIGSEVSRACKWKNENTERSLKSVDRALELLCLALESLKISNAYFKIKEICYAKEVLIDYFYGNNYHNSNNETLLKYYDDFAFVKSNIQTQK